MHSSVNNHDTSTSILSLKEIIAIVIVFAFVLYLLFPKDNIESFVENSKENTNLSINYIESMLLYHPDNVKLKMLLVKKYDYMGKTKKALNLNSEIIKETHDKVLLTKLYKTQYLLNKDIYYRTEKPQQLKILKQKLLRYYEFTKGHRDYLFFFAESTNIDYTYLRYLSLNGLMKQQPELIDYEFEKINYYLANRLGYKEEAYKRLIKLLDYKEIDPKLQEYAINSLILHEDYDKAYATIQSLFLKSNSQENITKYFYTSLYVLVKNPHREKNSIRRLIEEYIFKKELDSSDIYTIINTLLQQGRLKKASYFALDLFEHFPNKFDERSIDLALKTLIYDSQLTSALGISSYAEDNFHKEKYLDKSIQIATWLGEMYAVTQLNIQGYHEYGDSKYEQYLLTHANMNSAYEILGQIYKNKVEQGNYTFVEKLSEYFDYTGEIDKAESYFTKRLKKDKEIHAQAVRFSFDNSHFKKGLKLYQSYKKQYGINASLQKIAIKRALAIKEFSTSYALAKELNKANKLQEKRLLVDLAWQQKDYSNLHQALWKFEENKQLNSTGYERLMVLEKGLNGGKKIDYLYLKAWRETQNSNSLLALLYHLSDKKEFKKFEAVIKSLKSNKREELNNNIDYQLLLANFYVQNSKTNLALEAYEKAFKLAPKRVATHKSYLWLLIDNLKTNPKFKYKITKELSLLRQDRELQQKVGIVSVVSAMQVAQLELAKQWSQQLLKEHPQSKEYKELINDIHLAKTSLFNEAYEKIYNDEHIHYIANVKQKHLSSLLDVEEQSFTYQWRLYKQLKASMILSQEKYISSTESTKTNKNIGFTLKNSNSKLLWDFALAYHNSQDDFVSSSLNLGYNLHPFQVTLNSKYHNKTELTPFLEREGIQNALGVNIQTIINRRISLGFLEQKSRYLKQNGEFLGEGETTQLNANYILRSGYPDITFNSYLVHSSFSSNIAEDFSEFGLSTTIGASRQNSFNHGWKPFGIAGMAINNHHNLGASLSLGISKIVEGKDSLDILLNYSKGVGTISEPFYGANIRYRF